MESTQVETRLPSVRPRRSLLPGPKSASCSVKPVNLKSIPLSPTSPSSTFKHLQIGNKVGTADGKFGILKFKGKTHFAQGFLCGIELFTPSGKHNGSVDGIHYFDCADHRGVFIPAYKVYPIGSSDAIAEEEKENSETKLSLSDPKVKKKIPTVNVNVHKLPRPKTLPFTGETVTTSTSKVKSYKGGKTKFEAYKVEIKSCQKESQLSTSKFLPSNKISPINSCVTCPGWLEKEPPLSPNSRFFEQTRKETVSQTNRTFTIPGDEQTNLKCSFSGRKKSTKTFEIGNRSKVGKVARKSASRLESHPSLNNLSQLVDYDYLGAVKPDVIEGCQARTRNKDTIVLRKDASITCDTGSQSSLSYPDDASLSRERSDSSLAWDFDLPDASTPVELHLKVTRGRRSPYLDTFQDLEYYLPDDDTSSVDTDADSVEYNEFLAIPSFLNTPTGRCKFDLLTPDELEQALNEYNLLPGNFEDIEVDEEFLESFNNLQRTPIWEPITPVEEEFLPITGETKLDPNPLAFWSMDSVPPLSGSLKSDGVPDPESQKQDAVSQDMKFTTCTTVTLDSGLKTTTTTKTAVEHVTFASKARNNNNANEGEQSLVNSHDRTFTKKKTDIENVPSKIKARKVLMSPVDLLEGLERTQMGDDTCGASDSPQELVRDRKVSSGCSHNMESVSVEVTFKVNDQPHTGENYSDSSTASNKTVTENGISNVELKVRAAEIEKGDSFKQSPSVEQSENVTNGEPAHVRDENSNTLQTTKGIREKPPKPPKKKSLLLKPKLSNVTNNPPKVSVTNPSSKPNATHPTENNLSKPTYGTSSWRSVKPPVKSSNQNTGVARRKSESGNASAKLAEVKSRIDNGRSSANLEPGKGSATSSIKSLRSNVSDASAKKDGKPAPPKVSKKPAHLRTDKDKARKPSTSSVTSESSRGRADSKGSVSSTSRPGSRSDMSSEAKRSARKSNTTAFRNVTITTTNRTSVANRSKIAPPTRLSQPRAASTTTDNNRTSNVTNTDAAPTRKPSFGMRATRKPLSADNKTKRKSLISKDGSDTSKIKSALGPSTPPDVVYTSVVDTRTNEEVKRLETLCETKTKQILEMVGQLKHNASGFDSMVQLVNYLCHQGEAFSVPKLKEGVKLLEDKLTNAKEKIACQESDLKRLQNELSNTKQAHEIQVNAMRVDHADVMTKLEEDLKNRHKEEIDALRKSHEEAVQSQEDRHQNEMETIVSMQHQRVDKLNEQHMDHLAEMQEQLDRRTEEAATSHTQEIKRLQVEAAAREQALQDELLTMKYQAEIQMERMKMLEDALKKDSDSKVQAAIAQFKHLPEEVESLKTVLDLRNIDIQEMRRQLMEAKKELEKLPEREDKIKRLEAKVEDLKALMENKVTYERQLSSEQVVLRQHYERETNANKRLSMENEELQWRLSMHSDGSSPGCLTPPRFNPSPSPSPTKAKPSFDRSGSSDSRESGVFSPSQLHH